MKIERSKLIKCKICNSLVAIYSKHNRWNIYKCTCCGFGFADVSESDILDFYNSEYFSGETAQYSQCSSDIITDSKRWLLDNFISGEDLSCLEIGPGPAALIPDYFNRSRNNIKYQAVEISEVASAELRRRGFNVLSGHIYSPEVKSNLSNDYDYVIATEVIEHDLHPWKFASAVFDSLRIGGKFFFTTGNFDGVTARIKGANWYYLDPPAHVSFFTTRSLIHLLKGVGFTDIRIKYWGLAYINLHLNYRIPGLLTLVHALRIPTGMCVTATK